MSEGFSQKWTLEGWYLNKVRSVLLSSWFLAALQREGWEQLRAGWVSSCYTGCHLILKWDLLNGCIKQVDIFNMLTVPVMSYALRCSLLAKLLKTFFSVIVILRVIGYNQKFKTIARPTNSFGLTPLFLPLTTHICLRKGSSCFWS